MPARLMRKKRKMRKESYLMISTRVLSITGMFLLAGVVSGCSSDPEDGGERFRATLVGPMSMEILSDEVTGLTWVNDARGCFAAITTPGDQCDNLVFAGRDDWRMPTSMELSELLSEISARGLNLNYINASCSVMTASDGWVFTENSNMPGGVTNNMPGNAGIRCVRSTMN